MSKIVIIGALAESLLNFRGDLIRSLVASGHTVVAMAGPTDEATCLNIEAMGASFVCYPVQRNGMNPSSDLGTFRSLRRAFAEIKPDVVLAYTIKPVIWGGLAMRSLGTDARFYGMITGLGLAFQRGGFKQKMLTDIVTRLYRWALHKADAVIFQNQDNQQVFIERNIVDARRCVLVNGSGVNVDHFGISPLPTDGVVFLSIARLLGAKGLREYAAAAEIVKKRYPAAVFNLAGPEDPSPDGIPMAEIRSWQASGAVHYLGAFKDVRPIIESCQVYVLASYHEGMPRTILEAMSMGRPILTTDVSGCNETVVPGENGYLVPKQNSQSLAERMIWFIENRERWERMALSSRRIAEDRFDVHKVNRELTRIMELAQ